MKIAHLKKFRIFLLIAAAVTLMLVALHLLHSPRPPPAKVTILDKKLEVFWAEVVKGTNNYYLRDAWGMSDSTWLASKFEGEMRLRLRRWGIKVEALPTFTVGPGPNARVFMVNYNYPLPQAPDGRLDAEVVAPDGTAFQLKDIAGGGGGPPQRYFNIWRLTTFPTNYSNYFLRLKLQTNGTPVGEIRFVDP